MVEDYKKYYYGRTDMIMLNDEKVYGSLGINLKEVTTIVEGYGSVVLHNSLKKPFRKFELLGNSTQGENPSPDNPQEIKSVGRKSKNLFDAKQLQGIPGFGVDGNEITQSAYNISTGKTLKQLCPAITPGTYFLSASNNEFTGLFGLTKPFYKNKSMEITEEDLNRIVALVGATNKTIKFTLQLEKGDKATDYEPYSDKHFVDLKVTGKNLLSNKSADWQIGKGLSWSTYPNDPISIYRVINSAVNVINLKPSTTYSIVNNSEKIVISRMIERNLSENGIKDHNVRSSKYTFVTNQNAMNAILQLKKVDGTELLSSDIESIKIMLVEGDIDESTPYEPYTEQTLTLTSDRPLTKWDKLVEQGGEYGWLYNGEIAKEFTFVSKASDENINGRIRRRFKTSLNGKFPQVYKVMCNFLTTDNVRNDYSIGTVGSGDIYIYFYENTGIETVEQANNWLKNLPFEKTIIFERKNSNFVPLSESVQQQLQALHSENGTTNIMVDSGEVPCGIKVEYVVGV